MFNFLKIKFNNRKSNNQDHERVLTERPNRIRKNFLNFCRRSGKHYIVSEEELDHDEFSKEQIEELREAFNIFDKDGDGCITTDELYTVMTTLRQETSEQEIREMIQQVDLDEFKGMVKRQTSNSSSEKYEFEEIGVTMDTHSELKLAFSLFDKDRDGNISKEELRYAMDALGVRVSDKQLTEMFSQVDLDGNGLIDYEEFVRLMESRTERQSEDAEMRAYFSAFDKDNNGYIDANELKTTLLDLGMTVTDYDVREMMKEVGVEIQGRIYYEDFVKMMTGKIGRAHRRISSRMNSEGSSDASSIPIDDEEEEDPETRELRVAFAMFDKDGDGSVTSKELLMVMQSLGIDTNTEQVRQMIRKVDLDGNGTIEFEEFKKLMRKRKQLAMICRKDKRVEEEEMRQAFRVFDKDGSGFIDANDLRQTMRELGVELTQGDVTAMMTEAGVKVDGRIYYEDFVRIMFGQILKPVKEIQVGEMTQEQLQELKVAFALFDKDGDGCITTSELRSVMKSLGFNTSNQEVAKMIDRYDYDANGTLEFEEFVRMMTSKNKKGVTRWERSSQKKTTEPDSWRAFKMFDKDRNGYISPTELKLAMSELGVNLTDEDVILMIREADLDGDGKINYKEFVNMMDGKFVSDTRPPVAAQNTEPEVVATCASLASSAPPSDNNKHPNNVASMPPGDLSEEDLLDKNYIDELHEAFKMFDRDNDGRIQASELGSVMRMLGRPFAPEDLSRMIQNAAPRDVQKTVLSSRSQRGVQRGNGTVDFQEFLQMMSRSKSRQERSEELRRKVMEEEMRQAFKVFDIDGNGVIDAQELRLTMQNLGENLSEEDVQCMISEADMNGDGKIDYEEFIRMMYNKSS